jgi:L-rhamnose mutarotase
MERALFYLRIFPGTEAEYDRRHAEIWPELVDEIRESGIHNFTGFRRGTDVWYYGEYEPDARTAFAMHGPKPANQRWNSYFDPIIAQITDDSGELLWYREVFHSDSPETGPFQRGLLSLVVEPSRIPEYEERHANPWPEMMDALAATGFGNYSGFRRGNHVVYYGEFRPDMDGAFARIGATDVNRRWGEAFGGIITTITNPDGSLITAQEVYHQD